MSRMLHRAALAGLALSTAACATGGNRPEPVVPLRGPQETAVETDYTSALRCLGAHVTAQPFPAPRIAVGHVSDMTGASDYFSGSRVTQGATLMAITALADAGVRVVERFDMGVIQAEMSYAQDGLVRDSARTLRELSPGIIEGADLYIVGGLTEFNPNIRSRGADFYGADESASGAALSFGVNTHTIDVALDLRLVDARSSEVLSVRALRKQMIGREVEAGVFEFMSGGVVDIGAGQRALEPVQTEIRTMIDRAVFEFVGSLYGFGSSDCLDGAAPPAPQAQATAQPARGRLAAPSPGPALETGALATGQAAAPPEPAAAQIGLHLASYREGRHAEAGWAQLQARHTAALAGTGPRVVPAEVEGRGLYFRLLAGPITDTAEAERRCAQITARGDWCAPVNVTEQ